MKQDSYRGLYPATITPFAEDYSIDLSALESHLASVAAAPGVRGLAVNGHLGELLALSTDERAEVVRIAASVRHPGQRVIAGVEARTAAELIREAERARDAGADSLLVMPPLDVRPYRRLLSHVPSVLHFFGRLDAEVGLPMIVHQYPAFTGTAYSMEALDALADLPRVAAFKVASVVLTDYMAVWDRFKDRVSVLAATDAPALLSMLMHGSHGALIGIGAIRPELWAELLRLAEEREFARAQELSREFCLPLMESVFQNQTPTRPMSEAGATKEALVQLGLLSHSRVRPPAVGVSEVERAEIARVAQIAAAVTVSA